MGNLSYLSMFPTFISRQDRTPLQCQKEWQPRTSWECQLECKNSVQQGFWESFIKKEKVYLNGVCSCHMAQDRKESMGGQVPVSPLHCMEKTKSLLFKTSLNEKKCWIGVDDFLACWAGYLPEMQMTQILFSVPIPVPNWMQQGLELAASIPKRVPLT